MSTIALAHTTFADAAEAERVASAMIADRLAASVTIHPPARSIYRRDCGIERAQEVPATFRTAGIRARQLADEILRQHSYAMPVIESCSADVGEDVAGWVRDATC